MKITKTVDVTVDIEIARIMLRVAGYSTKHLTDDQIFKLALSMSEKYGVETTVRK